MKNFKPFIVNNWGSLLSQNVLYISNIQDINEYSREKYNFTNIIVISIINIV